MGDIGGWVHADLDTAPPTLHIPLWGTVEDLDYAGNTPSDIVRVGNAGGQVATSSDGGNTWTEYANAPSGTSGGHVTYSANATSIIWSAGSPSGVFVAKSGGAFVAATGVPAGAFIEADKSNDNYVRGTPFCL